MAENLDIRGRIDIDFGDAISNFEALAAAGSRAGDALEGGGVDKLEDALKRAGAAAETARRDLEDLYQLSDTELGQALTLDREVGLSKEYSDALKQVTENLTGVEKASLEVSAAQDLMTQNQEKQAKLQQQIASGSKGYTEEVLKKTVALENAQKAQYENEFKQLSLQEQLGGLRETHGEKAKELTDQLVEAQQAEEQIIFDLVQAEHELNEAREQGDASAEEEYNKSLEEQLNLKHQLSSAEKELNRQTELQATASLKAESDARRDALREEERQIGSLANTRYALYDLSNTWTAVSAATLGSAAAAVKLGADYDKAFASVRRTTLATDADAERLKKSLVDLTHEMPAAFDEMTEIATLGAQMDVPTESLENFTETVAMFATTTGVSVDEAAMSLGRLAQLTETPIDNIDALGASIYHTGINSVATEQQILQISEQIAVSGNLAGFANHEIIGLSAALASLGVQPEKARGAIMRVFNTIRSGVDEGGEALQQFAEVSNMTMDEFADMWLQNPQEAFSAFIEGLEGVAASGGNLSGVLKDMHITNVRDLEVLSLLADNTEVYNDAMANSASSYAQNTALAEGYNIETENLKDQLVLLFNIFKDMLQSMGDIPFLTELVKSLQFVAKAMRNLLDIPFVGTFAKFGLAVMGAVGAWAAYQAVMTRATASTMGLKTALDGIEKSAGVVNGGVLGLLQALGSLRGEMQRINALGKERVAGLNQEKAATDRLTASTTTAAASTKSAATETTKLGAANTTAATSAGRLSAGMRNAAASIKTATTAFKGFARATLVLAAISAAISLAEKAWDGYKSATQSAEDATKNFIGSADGLLEAMKRDGDIFDETGGQVGEYVDTMEYAKRQNKESEEAFFSAADGQLALKSSTEEATQAIEDQTLAMGANARQHFAEIIEGKLNEMDLSVGASELLAEYDWGEFMDRFEQDVANGTDTATEHMDSFFDSFSDMNINYSNIHAMANTFDDLTTAIVDGKANAEFYTRQFDELMSEFEALGPEFKNNLTPATREFFDTLSGKDADWLTTKEGIAYLRDGGHEAAAELKGLGESALEAAPHVKELQEGLSSEGLIGLLKTTAINGGIAQEVIGEMGEEAEDAADGFDELNDAIEDLSDGMFDGIDSAIDMESALEDLGASLFENGQEFNEFSEEGRTNLENLQSVISAMAQDAGEDTAAFVSNVMELMGSLEAQGIDTVNELSFVYEHLLMLTGQKYGVDVSTQAARTNLLNLLQDGEAVQALLANLGAIRSQIKTAVGNRDWGSALALGQQHMKGTQQLAAVNDIKKQLSSASDVAASTGNAISNGLGRGWDDAAKAARKSGGAGKKAGNDHKKGADKGKKATKELKKELYTITDYAKDLGSVMSSAFEFRFGGLQSRDATRDIYASMKENIESAAEAYKKAVQDIMDANAKLKTLRSDKQILEYQLTVATEYGDDLRASQIRAELAEKNAEIAKTEKERADAKKAANKAEKDGSKTLKGTSDAARRNRADILSLVESYQKQVEELANTGMSTSKLEKETKKLKKEFIQKTTQMGYSRKEVNKYAKSFDDMGTIIKTMPKNITVKTNMSPAKRAVQEFIKKKEKNKQINTTAKKPTKKSVNAARKAASGSGSVPIKTRVQAPTRSSVTNMGKKLATWIRAGLKVVRMGLSFLGRSASLRFFQSGGYTGAGNPNELAGLTHKGEYVVPHQYVNQSTGLPDLNALGESLGMTTQSTSVVSSAGTGISVVELSARDRQLLAAAGNVTLNLDGKVLANNNNRHNTNSSRRGIG